MAGQADAFSGCSSRVSVNDSHFKKTSMFSCTTCVPQSARNNRPVSRKQRFSCLARLGLLRAMSLRPRTLLTKLRRDQETLLHVGLTGTGLLLDWVRKPDLGRRTKLVSNCRTLQRNTSFSRHNSVHSHAMQTHGPRPSSMPPPTTESARALRGLRRKSGPTEDREDGQWRPHRLETSNVFNELTPIRPLSAP